MASGSCWPANTVCRQVLVYISHLLVAQSASTSCERSRAISSPLSLFVSRSLSLALRVFCPLDFARFSLALAMDGLVVEKKRPLEAGSEEEAARPESKRLRREDGEEKEEAASSSSCGFPQILELEQEEEEDERGIQQEDVTDVMRSLERELGVESTSSGEAEASSSSSQSHTPSPSSSRMDLGFLLEASDDELGIGDDDSGSGSGLDCVDDTALVEEEDLSRGDSWSDGDWLAACSGLEDEQQWVRRSVEMFLASPCSSTQPAFEAAPLLIEL